MHMPETLLVIGDKKRSSWSLRPWLFLRHHGVAFREVGIALEAPDTRAQILKHSPSGKVPCLIHNNVKVWESLAICEQAAEMFKLRDAWPSEPEARALARSVAMEMHAGFSALRRELPFDATRMPQTQACSADCAEDIARIRQIWRDARGRFGREGDWLFGRFGIADAMFAAVAVRFHTYGVPLDGPEKDYVRTVLGLPALREWLGAALLEMEVGEDDGRTQPATKTPLPAKADKPAEPAPPAARPKSEPILAPGGIRIVSKIIPP